MFQFHIGLMSEIELTHAHKIASEIEYAIEMEFHENIRSSLEIISHIEPRNKLPPGKIHFHSERPIPTEIKEIITNRIQKNPCIQTWNLMNVINEDVLSSISITIYIEGTLEIEELKN